MDGSYREVLIFDIKKTSRTFMPNYKYQKHNLKKINKKYVKKLLVTGVCCKRR